MRAGRAIVSLTPWLVGLSVVAAAAAALGPPQQRVVLNGLVNLVAVLGLSVFCGNTGIVSFGHVAFMGAGAYLGGILTMPPAVKAAALPELPGWLAETEFSLLAAVIIATVVVTAFGAVAGLPVARAGGTAATIMTLGMLVIGQVLMVGAVSFTRGNQVFYGVPQTASTTMALGVAMTSLVAARWFKSSRMGMFARAVRDDEYAAKAVGARPFATRLVAWCLSVALSAAAGVLFAHSLGALAPNQFSFAKAFALIAMLIVGGASSVTGAVVGVLSVTATLEVLRVAETQLFGLGSSIPLVGLPTAGLAVLLLAVMYVRTAGVLGDRELELALQRRGSS